MNYLATFYTQAAALLSQRALKQAGLVSKAGPVPRELSSSCGTCVRYIADDPNLVLLDHDLESLYEVTDGSYRQIIHRD